MKPKLQIVLPVLNEEISFKKNVLRLYKIISNSLTEYEWTITIVNNGSIDRTIEIVESQENLDKLYYYIINLKQDKFHPQIRP